MWIEFLKKGEKLLEQIKYFLGAFLALPLLPILMYQGKKVRATIPELGEAQGATTGSIGAKGKPLHLLALGESTFAGVGVATHEEGIVAELARLLSVHYQCPVEWRVLAKSGYTAAQVRDELVPQIPDSHYDIIVIGLGGNETFKLNRPLRWRNQLRQIIQKLRARQPQTPIFIANLPPVGEFPAFPPLMQFFLGGLVQLHGRVIRSLPAEFERVYYDYQPITFAEWSQREGAPVDTADYFSDGVHPAKITYEMWARELKVSIVKRL